MTAEPQAADVSIAYIAETVKAPQQHSSTSGEVSLHKHSTTADIRDLQQKAKAASAGFKRPAIWVMVLGWSLALCAGLVNVVCMQSLGTYVSHVTGSTTAIGLRLEGFHSGRHEFEPLGEAILLVLSFLLGAFLCGVLIDKNQVHLGGKSFYGLALVGNGVLLLLTVLVAPDSKRLAGCLASMACGLQNAMCTAHFGAVVRTTHVTGTVTDIGSTLGRLCMIYLRRGCRHRQLNILERAEVGVDARKLLVLGPMWLSFLLGCIIGAFLGSEIGIYALLFPAGFTSSVGLMYMLFRQRFKKFFKQLMQERLSADLARVDRQMALTQDYLGNLRKSNPNMTLDDATPGAASNADEIDLDELESQVEHVLDTIHQVEVDIEDLQSHHALPLHRPEAGRAVTEASSAHTAV